MKTVFLGGMALLVLWQSDTQAASVDNGRHLFEGNCVVCHGTPPDNLIRPKVMIAADNPNAIRNAFNIQPQMSFLNGAFSDSELRDIAKYLAKPTTTDSDRLFDWGQATYPELLSGVPVAGTALGYYYRYYPITNVYVGTQNRDIFFYDPSQPGDPLNLGSMESFMLLAEPAGY